MKIWNIVITTVFLMIVGLAGSGCLLLDDSDAHVTCQNYDRFLYHCTDYCDVTWDCEREYRHLSYRDQVALDRCSDCLRRNVDSGTCWDCEVPEEGIYSCYRFMDSLLGVDCW